MTTKQEWEQFLFNLHHDIPNQTRWCCFDCKKVFKKARNWSKHNILKHGDLK